MSIRVRERFVLLPFLLSLAAAADDPTTGEHRRENQQRLEFMKAKLSEFQLEAEREPPLPLSLSTEPVLRWTNPLRFTESDGATFFWLLGSRPVAAATISIRDQGQVFREFALLGDEPLVARRQGAVVWSPRKNGVPFGPLIDSAPPAESPALRLTQMRALARRFHVGLIKGKRIEARLLSQPLLRYADPGAGILDGGVFGFVEATDPEVLLLLEVRRDDAHREGRWQFSVARMSSPPVEVQLEKEVLWTAPSYWKNPRSKADSYVEAFEGTYAPPPIDALSPPGAARGESVPCTSSVGIPPTPISQPNCQRAEYLFVRHSR